MPPLRCGPGICIRPWPALLWPALLHAYPQWGVHPIGVAIPVGVPLPERPLLQVPVPFWGRLIPPGYQVCWGRFVWGPHSAARPGGGDGVLCLDLTTADPHGIVGAAGTR